MIPDAGMSMREAWNHWCECIVHSAISCDRCLYACAILDAAVEAHEARCAAVDRERHEASDPGELDNADVEHGKALEMFYVLRDLERGEVAK